MTEVIDGQSVTSSYSYDDRGRLISYTPALPAGYGSITYTWGLQGQKTSMTVPMGNNSAKRYSYYYDKEGRQVGMDVEAVSVTSSPTLTAGSSGSNTRFFYDNSKNRVKLITKSGDVYYFVYDPTASIPAVVYEAAGTTAYLNTREPSGALISREKYTGGVYQYSRTYHFDGLGSTIALTDENGVTTDTYSYDAWGNATHTSGTTADNPYQYGGKYGYYTHYQEPTFKLLQLGVRYYDPSIGRFTQLDPMKDGANWYGYAGGNPMNYSDAWGLVSLPGGFGNWSMKDQFEWLTKELNKRWGDMYRDDQHLYPDRTGRDGTTWPGHENKYNEYQRELKDLYKKHREDPEYKNDPDLRSKVDEWRQKKHRTNRGGLKMKMRSQSMNTVVCLSLYPCQ